MKKLLINLLSAKENVEETGNKYIFSVKTEEGSIIEDLGTIRMQQTVAVDNKGFINAQTRYLSSLGKIEGLNALLDELEENGKLPGRLIVKEFVESEIPEDYVERYFNSNDDDPRARYRKVNVGGEEGVLLTHNGEQIFKFIKWVFDDEPNVYIQHDEDLTQ